jgi:subfamily B ATP-binding cassette protein MsbA
MLPHSLHQRIRALFAKPDPEGKDSNLHLYCYLYGRLYPYLKPYLFRVIVVLLITFPIGALDASIALCLRPYMDGMHKVNANTSLMPLLIVGLTIVQGGLNYLSIYLNGWLSFYISTDIRRNLFRKLLSMQVQYFDITTSGHILARYWTDSQGMQMNLLLNLKTSLTLLFSSLALCTTLLLISWKLSLVAVTILLFILLPSTRIRQSIKNLSRELLEQSGDLVLAYNEVLGGIKVIHGYSLHQYLVDRFNATHRLMFDSTIDRVKAQGWLTPIMHIIASIGIAIVIWQGSRLVNTGEMTTGSLVSFIAALIMLYNPVKNLGPTLMNARLSMIAAIRVFDTLDQIPQVADAPDAIPLAVVREGIAFHHVHFTYSSDKKSVFEDFNLRIGVGETVALVGNSGGGKSTVANLISRFYDVQQGRITIDGVDIRQLQLESLRRQIAMVMQDNFLFDGTIRDNIMMGNLDASDDRLFDAIDKAYLTDFICSLSSAGNLAEGLNTRIGERGVMLSGGQRQRVAIARAILKDTPIVILDEATSALDNQSETIVQQAMAQLMKNRTVLVIAHRLSTVREADRIVVLDHGRIVEEGPHEALLAKNGAYAALYVAQFKAMEGDIPLGLPESSVFRSLAAAV